MRDVPRQVFVFSGHLVDEPGRTPPRLPDDRDTLARIFHALDDVLDAYGAGADDLALTQGACGGDLIFTAACVARGVPVRWLQPFDEAHFIAGSVDCAGEDWHTRYTTLRAQLAAPPRALTAALGAPLDASDDPYRRCNQWLLDTARTYGLGKLRVICVWDGAAADTSGGTAAMVNAAGALGAPLLLIDPRPPPRSPDEVAAQSGDCASGGTD